MMQQNNKYFPGRPTTTKIFLWHARIPLIPINWLTQQFRKLKKKKKKKQNWNYTWFKISIEIDIFGMIETDCKIKKTKWKDTTLEISFQCQSMTCLHSNVNGIQKRLMEWFSTMLRKCIFRNNKWIATN